MNDQDASSSGATQGDEAECRETDDNIPVTLQPSFRAPQDSREPREAQESRTTARSKRNSDAIDDGNEQREREDFGKEANRSGEGINSGGSGKDKDSRANDRDEEAKDEDNGLYTDEEMEDQAESGKEGEGESLPNRSDANDDENAGEEEEELQDANGDVQEEGQQSRTSSITDSSADGLSDLADGEVFGEGGNQGSPTFKTGAQFGNFVKAPEALPDSDVSDSSEDDDEEGLGGKEQDDEDDDADNDSGGVRLGPPSGEDGDEQDAEEEDGDAEDTVQEDEIEDEDLSPLAGKGLPHLGDVTRRNSELVRSEESTDYKAARALNVTWWSECT